MALKTKIAAFNALSTTHPDDTALLQHSTLQAIARHLPIALILLLATVLFTFKIGDEGLWLDELNSLRDITERTPWQLLSSPVRPLYYLIMMGWIQTGTSDAWLRLPSVFFAVISVYLLYSLGAQLLGKREGLIAALMLTLSPIVVNHAQEIRMYTLSLCLTLAGTVCLAKALIDSSEQTKLRDRDTQLSQSDQSPKAILLFGWVSFRLLSMYTVPLNVLLLAPDALVILTRFWRQRAVLVSFAKWMLLLGALWLPAIFAVAVAAAPDSGYAQDHSGQVPPGAAEVVRLLKFFTVWPFRVQENAAIALFYKVFTLLVMGLAGAGIIRKHKSPHLFWIGAWCVLPILPIVVFSYTVMPVWRPRYLLFVIPYLFLLLASGLVRLWKSWRASAAVIAAVYIVAASGGLFHHYTVQERSDYKFNVATIEQYEQPGDGLVWSYECCKRGLHRYYQGEMEPQFNSVATIKSVEDIPRWIEQFPADKDRLWLVLDNLIKDKERIISELANVYSIEQTFDYEQGSKVMLLTPLGKATANTATQDPAPVSSALTR